MAVGHTSYVSRNSTQTEELIKILETIMVMLRSALVAGSTVWLIMNWPALLGF